MRKVSIIITYLGIPRFKSDENRYSSRLKSLGDRVSVQEVRPGLLRESGNAPEQHQRKKGFRDGAHLKKVSSLTATFVVVRL
jgi:hypothetical protein